MPITSFGKELKKDSITGKIEKVEYTNEGFRVYSAVKNDAKQPISSIHMKFELTESKFEQEVNSLGYSHYVNHQGWIYDGETCSGYYEWHFNRKIEISKVILYVMVERKEEIRIGEWKNN